jgi:hypothetical protein
LLKFFYPGGILCEELKLYQQLSKVSGVSKEQANRIISMATEAHSKINQTKIFEAQTSLISRINNLSKDAFTAFVPNYRDLASIYQLFHLKSMPLKNRVLLESALVDKMIQKEVIEENTLQPIDAITFKMFVKRFNEKYGKELLGEQKKMIALYILSIEDKGAALKLYLNEEIGRLKEALSKPNKEVSENKDLSEKCQTIVQLLESVNHRKRDIDEQLILRIMKVQELVNELGV